MRTLVAFVPFLVLMLVVAHSTEAKEQVTDDAVIVEGALSGYLEYFRDFSLAACVE
jgi:hypothetical protein